MIYFLFDDVRKIKKIPLSLCNVQHQFIWHFDKKKKGSFLVKSTYMVSTIPLAQMINAQNHPLPWSKIWSLDIPPKIKHFFWKACNNVIPVKKNLVKRNINTPFFPNVHVMHKLE